MTRAIHLDPGFIPLVYPEIEFKMIKFSGGELHPKLNPKIDYSNVEKVIITQRVNNSDNLMSILVIADALKRIGVKSLDLIMPYIPYARQDRYDYVDNFGESFTLDVFANIINSVGFETVTVLDAHSEVSLALIKNVRNISNTFYVDSSIKDIRIMKRNPQGIKPIWIISPDSGANKKSNKLMTALVQEQNVQSIGLVNCDKVRDIATGDLHGFKVFTKDLYKNDCLIVDDICDGGGTFMGLAAELRKHNAGDLYLYVTHGIFSKDADIKLLDHFAKIYTTNSIKDSNISNIFIKQFKIEI